VVGRSRRAVHARAERVRRRLVSSAAPPCILSRRRVVQSRDNGAGLVADTDARELAPYLLQAC
jgi:hypothetical protein